MTTKITICDDSSFARKQMARALPAGWDISLSFAENGAEGLDCVNQGKAELLFLDLNMPVMDGYQTLEAIRKQDLPAMTIVVSGDIQPEANRRVTALGALAFVKKPVDSAQIAQILREYGIYADAEAGGNSELAADVEVDCMDSIKEIANVAMGQAADLLARLLGCFVIMPIPKVTMLAFNELHMALNHAAENHKVSALCQGFIGGGIAGEALLMFNDSSFTDIAELLKHDGEIDENTELELLMDISNVLLGAYLRGIADQLNINISQSHPIVLGRHTEISDLINRSKNQWQQTLAIEIDCAIEDRDIHCDVLLLFTEDSVDTLNSLMEYV